MLPYNSKFPILLTTDCQITKLLVIQCHQNVAHNVLHETLNCLRRDYWVPRIVILLEN